MNRLEGQTCVRIVVLSLSSGDIASACLIGVWSGFSGQIDRRHWIGAWHVVGAQ